MKRTVALRLGTSPEQAAALAALQAAFADACNQVAAFAVEHRCFNRVALHHHAYYPVRAASPLGSQMVCNAVGAVAQAYRARKPRRGQAVSRITFRQRASVHFDQRTYSLKGETVSLYTLAGRIRVPFRLGEFQRGYLASGVAKEAELVRRNNRWYFHLVLDVPPPAPVAPTATVLGVDLGENVLAATSTGKLFGGGPLRDRRDRHLARRRRLQSHGSRSATRRLRQASGREQRHVRHVNHVVSKAIVAEALAAGADTIALEDLTHLRQRIRSRKRVRSRLHRWAWRQLQTFVEYKARAAGLRVVYLHPAYTSQVCSACGCLGSRQKHTFSCSSCGSRLHSDRNAAVNLSRLAGSADPATGAVNRPQATAA